MTKAFAEANGKESWSQTPLCHPWLQCIAHKCSHFLQRNKETEIFSYIVQNSLFLYIYVYMYTHETPYWTDLPYWVLKSCLQKGVGFFFSACFRQCCCLEVDTRHHISESKPRQPGAVKGLELFYPGTDWCAGNWGSVMERTDVSPSVSA